MQDNEFNKGAVGAAYPDDNPKTIIGLSKPSLIAIPPVALLHLGRAMTDGKNKYGLMNWREKRVSSSIYYDAALRHALAWWDGENFASDSGVHHLAHMMACAAIILDADSVDMLNDDRPKRGDFSSQVIAYTTAPRPE